MLLLQERMGVVVELDPDPCHCGGEKLVKVIEMPLGNRRMDCDAC